MSQVVHVVAAAISRSGRCLIAERGPQMTLPGKWEFPGGKVEPGEGAVEALTREIREELSVDIVVGKLLASGTAPLSDTLRIQLDVYSAELVAGEPSLHEHARVAWVSPDELSRFDWAAADVPCVPAVVEWLRASIV